MNIQLRYFTETGNSLKALNTIKESFSEAHHFVQISKIEVGETIPQCDIAKPFGTRIYTTHL
jgi:hypothetical protein